MSNGNEVTPVMVGQIVILPDGTIGAALVEGLDDPLMVSLQAINAFSNIAFQLRAKEEQGSAAKKIVRPKPVIYRP